MFAFVIFVARAFMLNHIRTSLLQICVQVHHMYTESEIMSIVRKAVLNGNPQ
jgi:hypothetical protein